MAQIPITTFSHNELAAYQGVPQKFIDAKQMGPLLDLIGVQKVIQVDYVSGNKDIPFEEGKKVLLYTSSITRVEEYKNTDGTVTPEVLWDKSTNKGLTLIKSKRGDMLVQDTTIVTTTGTISILAQVASLSKLVVTPETLIPIKFRWTLSGVNQHSIMELTKLPPAGILLFPLAQLATVTGDYSEVELVGGSSASIPQNSFGACAQAKSIPNPVATGLVYLPWHKCPFVAIQYKANPQSTMYKSYSALLSAPLQGVKTESIGVAHIHPGTSQSPNVVGASLTFGTNPGFSSIVLTDRPYLKSGENTYRGEDMQFGLTQILEVFYDGRPTGKGGVVAIKLQATMTTTENSETSDIYVAPCV